MFVQWFGPSRDKRPMFISLPTRAAARQYHSILHVHMLSTFYITPTLYLICIPPHSIYYSSTLDVIPMIRRK